MFLRIEDDLYVNITQIFSYKIQEDSDSFKLSIWGPNGNQVHQVIYLKASSVQMNLLIEVNNKLREHLINPDVVIPTNAFVEDSMGYDETPKQHIEEIIGEV